MARRDHLHSLSLSVSGARRFKRLDRQSASLGALGLGVVLLLAADFESPMTGLVFDPPQLVFGDQVLNTPSAPQMVTIRNSATGAVSFSALALSNVSAFAVDLTRCPPDQVLQPGTSCEALVTFRPRGEGASVGLLGLGASGPATQLRGTGKLALVTVGEGAPAGVPPSPPSTRESTPPESRPTSTPTSPAAPSVTLANVFFGSVETGAQETQKAVLINNPGSTRLVDVKLRFADGALEAFSPREWSCDPIAPGGSCSVSLTFQPTSAGTYQGTLVASLGNTPLAHATVTGTAKVPIPVAKAAFAPGSIDFGALQIGDTSRAGTVLTNTGEAPLNRVDLRIEDNAQSAFSINESRCDGLLQDGARCERTIVFQPEVIGKQFATLVAIAGTVRLGAVTLAGEGIEVHRSTVDVSPRDLLFPKKGSDGRITVRNTGNASLKLNGFDLNNPGAFNVSNDCGKELKPGDACTVKVTSRQNGAASGTITVRHDDASTGSIAVNLLAQAELKLIKVPNLRGDRQDAAEKKLKDRGLTLGTVTPAQSCDDLGKVVDQDPMKDVEVRSESAVNVTVRSTGPKPAMVPAISRGETQGVVVARIRAAGLSVSQKQNRRATFDFGPDTVVDVQPKPGTPLAPGCEVTLTVATTPQVSVPSYVGKTLADAKGFGTTLGNAFSGVAFMIGTATAADGTVVSGDEKSWRVVSQTPTAGTRVSTKSQQVDVVVERIESNASRPAPRPGAAIRVPDQPVIK